MTRSIGDFDLKNMGVIAEPETKRVTVSKLPFTRARTRFTCSLSHLPAPFW